MILVERRNIADKCLNGELSLTNDPDVNWREHPLVLTQSQFQSIKDINRVLVVLSGQSLPPTHGQDEISQDSILKKLNDNHADSLKAYRVQIVTASKDDLDKVYSFLHEHRNLHHKVGAGTAAGGAAAGAGIGTAIGTLGGPIGMAIGAGVGALVGSIAGGVTGHFATKEVVRKVAESKGQVHRFTALKMIDAGETSRLEDVKDKIDRAIRPIVSELQHLFKQGGKDYNRLHELMQLADVRKTLFPDSPCQVNGTPVSELVDDFLERNLSNA